MNIRLPCTKIICNFLLSCYLGTCGSYPGTTHLKEHVESLFDMTGIDEVTCRMWLCTDKITLYIIMSSTEEFLVSFEAKLHLLLPPSFLDTH
jgi:hypothetical protein